jgi:hypothetical protein
MATADKYGYRKYLTGEKGLKDEEVTYDNGSIYVKGKYFDSATPDADGSTYNTRSNLEKAYNNYRAGTVYDQYANNVLQKPKPIEKPQPYQLDPQILFSSPAYQTGMQAAQQGAATQQGNTLARLRAMGQGKSSYSEGVANQIGQQAVSDFNAKFIPQAMADDYRKYLDNIDISMKVDDANYKREGDYANALKGVAGDYYSLYSDGLKRESDARATNIKNAADLSEQFGIGVLPKESGEALFEQVAGRPTVKAQTEQRQYFKELVDASDKVGVVLPELADLIGVQAGTPTLNAQKEINDAAYQMGMLGVSQQQANTSEKQANISASRLQFDRDQASKPKETPGPKPTTIQDVSKYASGVARYKDGTLLNPDQVEAAILSYDLSEDEYRKLYATHGLKWGG